MDRWCIHYITLCCCLSAVWRVDPITILHCLVVYPQCGEWIRVRVHQMEPDLMEVGSNLEEALQLQTEHDQLLSKLQVRVLIKNYEL